MAAMQPEAVKELLRQVRFPGRSRDIVGLGFVKSIGVEGTRIEIEFTPDSINVDKVRKMEADVRDLLGGLGFEQIELHTEPPYDDDSLLLGGESVNPLQVDLREYGLEPTPDPDAGGSPHIKDLLARSREQGRDVRQAPEPEEAPELAPVDGPQGPSDPTYNGPVPVFQWQVDPQLGGIEPQKVKLSIDSWNYVVIWLVHPAQDLVYASVHARHWVAYNGKTIPNPAGRTEAVNLVYDRQREGIVAIYGTVKDFRPFVEAFRRAGGVSTSPGLSALGQGFESAAKLQPTSRRI